jgi:hypothetical protein
LLYYYWSKFKIYFFSIEYYCQYKIYKKILNCEWNFLSSTVMLCLIKNFFFINSFVCFQIYISIFSALITTVPVFFLTELFKRTKRKQETNNKTCSKNCPHSQCCVHGSEYRQKTSEKVQHDELLHSASFLMEASQTGYSLLLPHWWEKTFYKYS